MTDKVVYLAFENHETLNDDTASRLACRECRNKTFVVDAEKPGQFPLMKCACCGAHIGRFGWVPEQDE